MDCSKVGSKAELLACAWLLDKGYEVFRNVCPTGPADLVAWNREDEILLIDVKKVTISTKADGTRTIQSGGHNNPKIKYLYTTEDEVLGFKGQIPGYAYSIPKS